MKKITQLSKTAKAAAGSALLVGATVVGGAAFATAQDNGSSGDLGDFPAPFVDDGEVASSVVVGEDAQTIDVVAGIEVAGTLGNAAFTEETQTVEGQETVEVDGLDFEETVRNADIDATMDRRDYSPLLREKLEDGDGLRAVEEASLEVNYEDVGVNETYTTVEDLSEFRYDVAYTPDAEQGDTIAVLGEEYFVTSVDHSSEEVRLGSEEEWDGLVIDDEFEHGPYTVTIRDVNEDQQRVRVRVHYEGEQIASTTFDFDDDKLLAYYNNEGQVGDVVDSGDEAEDDDYDFQVELTDLWFGQVEDEAQFTSVYSDITMEQDEESPWDHRFNIDLETNTDDELEGVGMTFGQDFVEEIEDEEDEVEYLFPGDELQGPNEYFELENDGLTEEETTDFAFRDDYRVTFEDANGVEQSRLDLTNVAFNGGTYDADNGHDFVAIEGTGEDSDETFAVEITDVDTGNNVVEFEYDGEDFEVEEGETVSTGYGFDLRVESDVVVQHVGDDLTTEFGATLTYHDNYDADVGDSTSTDAIEVDEYDGSYTTTVVYSDGDSAFEEDEGDIERIEFSETDDDHPESLDDTDGEVTLTNFGSEVELRSETRANVHYPEEQRYQHLLFGESEVTAGEDQEFTTSEPTGWPESGALDSDDDIEDLQNSEHLVLVGGPEVNDLTHTLAEEGLSQAREDYTAGEANIELVEQAFHDDYHALVVAGETGDDTRAAANFLRNYQENSEDLAGQTQLTISTETGQVAE